MTQQHEHGPIGEPEPGASPAARTASVFEGAPPVDRVVTAAKPKRRGVGRWIVIFSLLPLYVPSFFATLQEPYDMTTNMMLMLKAVGVMGMVIGTGVGAARRGRSLAWGLLGLFLFSGVMFVYLFTSPKKKAGSAPGVGAPAPRPAPPPPAPQPKPGLVLRAVLAITFIPRLLLMVALVLVTAVGFPALSMAIVYGFPFIARTMPDPRATWGILFFVAMIAGALGVSGVFWVAGLIDGLVQHKRMFFGSRRT